MKKHWIAACIITPILALAGYFSVDLLFAEQPHVAKDNSAYPLIASSNCRYESGVCHFKNNELLIKIKIEEQRLQLSSSHPLSGAEAKINATGDTQAKMALKSEDPLTWSIVLPHAISQKDNLSIVLAASNSLYYGQTALTFMHKKTLLPSP